MRTSSAATTIAALVTLVGGANGCNRKASVAPSSEGGAQLAAVLDSGAPRVERVIVDAGPLARGIPVPQAEVDAELNPHRLAPYAGPTGTITGVVRVQGDEAPKVDVAIPFECGEAYRTYGRVFREGNGRTLADAMIAVTGYEGYLPAESDAQAVTISGCAYDRRTVVLMFGQQLVVSNTDRRLSFVPTLIGANLPAELVALPHGDPIRLYPTKVGHYALGDGMSRNWMYADVFVVRYRTHAVTGLDGAFRIEHVPAGKLKVSAYLPAIDSGIHPDVGVAQPATEREIELKEGETVKVDLALTYRRPKPPPQRPSAEPAPAEVR